MVDPVTTRDSGIERRKTATAWWIIGIFALVLLVWGIVSWIGDDVPEDPDVITAPAVGEVPAITPETEFGTADTTAPMDGAVDVPSAAPMPPPPGDGDVAAIPVRLIVITPAQYLGQPVVGTATVVDVPSDRGFWLEQDGERMFVVIARSPGMEDAVNVNEGQQVRLSGVVYDQAMASQIAGGLDEQTTQIISGQPAFLLADAGNIRIVDR